MVSSGMCIEITLNGEPRQAPAGLTVRALLDHFEIDPGRVAIEMNRQIVRKPLWEATTVPDGAVIEVVQFVGGG